MKKSWALLLLLSSSLLIASERGKILNVLNFRGGLNSNYSSLTIADNEVQNSLNVYFTKDNAVKKRQGYSLWGSAGGSSVLNAWSFTDTTNQAWLIIRTSTAIYASPNSGSFSTVIATVSSTVGLTSAVNAQNKIYFVNRTNGVFAWDGTTTTYIAGSPLGNVIAEWHGRVWVSGAANPNQNALYGSKYLDGTTWTTGTLATDPVTWQIGLNDNSDGITTLFSGLNDVLYVFKTYSISGFYGFDQTDFTFRILTRDAGCVDPQSLQPFKSSLVFLSRRGLESFDGAATSRISDKVKNKIDICVANSLGNFTTRSWTQTAKEDFDAGNITTATWLNTDVYPGSVALTTAAAIADFDDNVSTDFGAGTLVNVSSTISPGNLTLSTASAGIYQANSVNSYSIVNGTDTCSAGSYYQYFLSTQTYWLTGISLYMKKNSAMAGSLTLTLSTDSAHSTTIATIAPGDLATSLAYVTKTFSPILLTSGVTGFFLLTGGESFGQGAFISYDTSGAPYSLQATTTTALITSGNPCFGTFYHANLDTKSKYTFRFSGYVYNGTGSFTSQTFDTAIDTANWTWQWSNFSTRGNIPTGSSVTYRLQVSSDLAQWTNPVVISTGAGVLPASVGRYVRYLSTFTTTDLSTSPVISSFTISSTQRMRPWGTFDSAIQNDASISSWWAFAANDSVAGGGAHSFSMRAATGSFTVTSTFPAWVSIANNAVPTLAVHPYFQVRDLIQTGIWSSNPLLNDFTVAWNDGQVKPNQASIVYDDRYYLSCTTTTNGSVNESVFLLSRQDQLIYSLWDEGVGSFVNFGNSLYHGDSGPTGNVYLDNQGYSDNGKAINAFVQTKDYAMEGTIYDKQFEDFYLQADALGPYTISTSYNLDRATTTFALDTVSQDEQPGFLSIDLPFGEDNRRQSIGRTISFTIGNNVVDQPLTLYGGILAYRLKGQTRNLGK